MVLAVVEPQASGIGGGTFLLHFDGRQVEAYDGRETAPAAASERLLLRPDGKPMDFHEAAVGGRAVGVPGTVRVLELAHREHGRLAWARLFDAAIALADNGFAISPRLHKQLSDDPHLKDDPAAAAHFYDRGAARPAGFMLRNPELAEVLRRIAKEGSAALHHGDVAGAIAAKVRLHPTNAGTMTPEDLAAYQPKKRAALCHDYLALRICGFPPPGSAAIAVGQLLGILRHVHAEAIPLDNGLPPANWLYLYTEAARLAFADRAQYVGDPDFVEPPPGGWSALLDASYLESRAALIGPTSMGTARPGSPAKATSRYTPATGQPEYGTSHVSIFDAQGNAIAMTSTVEGQFGSRQMVKGFLLNNQLTDFAFSPADTQGRPVANRVQPGKRPRSSMAPTLVFDKVSGQVLMSLGSSGGAAIIHHTAKALYGVLHWELDMQRAIDLPNFENFNGPVGLEEGRFPRSTLDALRARGARVEERAITSGAQGLQRTPTGWFGGADPRREGVVMGD